MANLNPQKTHSRNTLFNVLGEGSWGFAMAFHNMNSVIPMFLAQLGASAFIIGIIPGGFVLLLAIPQLLSATIFRQSSHIKGLNVGLHFALTPIALGMGLVFYVFKLEGPTGIATYLTLWVIWSLSVGLLIPVWADFLAAITLSPKRGRFFGITFTANALMGMLGGFVLKHILAMESLSFPQNFGLAFLVMTAAILLGNSFFTQLKVLHPLKRSPEKQVSRWWPRLKAIYADNPNYRNYIISRALGAATMMPLAFYGVDLQARFGLPLSSAGTFTFFLVVGQAIFNLLFGYLGDLYGRRLAISGFFVGHLLAATTALLASEPWMAYLTFVFVGMGFGAGQSSFMVFIYEFAGEQGDRKLFYAALDTALAPIIILYISAGGWIVSTFGAAQLYLLSMGLVCTGLLYFLLKVKAPQST